MTSDQRHREYTEQQRTLHIQLVDRGILPSCLNCEHWKSTSSGGGCDLAQGATPPPATIVVACPEWQQEIPF